MEIKPKTSQHVTEHVTFLQGMLEAMLHSISNNFYMTSYTKFHSRRWGPLLPCLHCTRATLRSAPHRHEMKFFGTRVCKVIFKHLPQPLRRHMQSFRTLRQLLAITKIAHITRRGGSSKEFWVLNINIFGT